MTSFPPFAPAAAAAPALRIRDEEDAFVVTLAVPGVHPEDLDVRFCDSVLTICRLSTPAPGTLTALESLPALYRTVYLPHPVQIEGLTATLADGVLTVVAPKAHVATPVHVPVIGY